MNHSQPMSGRVNMRMSPARRPDARGMPSYCAWTAMFSRRGSGSWRPKRLTSTPARPEASITTPTRRVPAPPWLIREAERDAVVVEDGVDQPMLFEHPGAALLGMAQQDLVEFFAQHLKRLGRRRLARELEIGVPLVRAVGSPKARAPLLDEPGRRDRVAHAERAENLVGPRKLRFADVEARKSLALQHDDAPAALGQRRGGRGAARPPADDRHVVVPPGARVGHALARRRSPQSLAAVNVSHWPGSPVSIPRLNQRTRCAELPWVNESGTTRPWAWRWRRSSPIAAAAFRPSSMSPASRIWRARCGVVRPDSGQAVGLELHAAPGARSPRSGCAGPAPPGFARRSRAGSARGGRPRGR